MSNTEMDRDILAAAVDVVLELLDAAERRPSFPGPGRAPDDCDEDNERSKQELIVAERRRYQALKARLGADDAHGVPVARQVLELALGFAPTWTTDDSAEDPGMEDLYSHWLEGQRGSAVRRRPAQR